MQNKFLNFLTEMAHISGLLSQNAHSQEDNWNKYYIIREFRKLVTDKIGSNKLKLYVVGTDTYF